MLELTADNAPAYLKARGAPVPRAVRELGGGVSNVVLLVEADGQRFVLKQSLPKLRVEQDWFSDPGRIFREAAGLRLLAPYLPAGSVPEVLFEDRENYAFAMSAAPADAGTWKAQLIRGEIRPLPGGSARCWRRCCAPPGAARSGRSASATKGCSTSCGSTPTTGRPRGGIPIWRPTSKG